MNSIISRYLSNLTIEQLNSIALSNDILLSEEELNFTFNYIKKNWEVIISNPKSFKLNSLKDNYSEENFQKIIVLYQKYAPKYQLF